MNVMKQQLVSVRTLSNALDIPEKTIRAWVYKRTVPYRKIGKLVRFDVEEIRAWYNTGLVAPLQEDIVHGGDFHG